MAVEIRFGKTHLNQIQWYGFIVSVCFFVETFSRKEYRMLTIKYLM